MGKARSPRGTDLNKYLVFVLRHGPSDVGISVDREGWADVDEVVAKSSDYGTSFDREALVEAVADGDRVRLVVSDDGRRVRATHGHSIPVDLGLAETAPPRTLYRGIERVRIADVLRGGLPKLNRRKLYLYEDAGKAAMANVEGGERAILAVDAAGLSGTGQAFERAESGVWLTDSVPSRFLVEFEPAPLSAPEASDVGTRAADPTP